MKLRVSLFHWLAEQETVGHDIILPGRSTSCPTFFTQVTHTLGRKWPLSTHTHTPGETTNIDADTQAQTRMQGNGPHQRRAAGVCANANTHRHTLQNSYKPEITLPVHVNLTPPTPYSYTHTTAPYTVTGKRNHGIYPVDPYLWSQRVSPPPLQRGSPCLGDTLRQAWGTWMGRKGPRDTGGKRQERTLGAGGTVIPPKRVGWRD